jgi:acylpyruvate hydrolase
MRFASVRADGRELAAAVDDSHAIPLRGITELGVGTPSEVLRDPPLDRSAAIPLDQVSFRPVVPTPGKVFCVGLNYFEHIEESRQDTPAYPVLFTKFASTLAAPYEEIALPPESSAVDYEGELVVVIGRPGRRVPEAAALDLVAGVSVGNDVSMRDFQNKTHQWLPGKAWDRTTPVGPTLVTLEEAGDLSSLTLRTRLNGEVVQESPTALLIFDVARLVSEISVFTALAPGDLIFTGTPGGVGFRREPPRLLGDGDIVAVEVDGVGRIENRMTGAQAG